MSSSQYIKIFNDTVLKQSILQGYEYQRTDKNLGKFTMGELAFTRDTGRVFVGTYTDNKKSSDIPYVIDDKPNPGGLLVGNKYYGASNDGKTLTHYPSYNSNHGVYNGDYTFDKTTCSLMLFDNTIKKSNKVTDDIYDDGFIRMRILEPDGVTIMYDSDKKSHNVLKADFKFERVSKYFGNDWTVDSNTEKIKIKNINLSNTAICKLPSTVNFNNTSITINGESEIGYKFPSFLTCVEKTTDNTYNLSFKKFSDVIKIVGGDKIKIEETIEEGKTPFFKISYDDNTEPNIPDNMIDNNENSYYDYYWAYCDPWDISMSGNYQGVVNLDGDKEPIDINKYSNTTYLHNNEIITNDNKPANNNAKIDFSIYIPKINETTKKTYNDVNNIKNKDLKTLKTELEKLKDEKEIAKKEEEINEKYFVSGLIEIKNKYSGGYYNIGLNYLKSADKTIESDKEYNLHELYFTATDNTYEDEKFLYVPYHAQSVILQVTTTSTTTSTNNAVVKHISSTGPILFQSKTSGEVTTVEIPLIPYGFWSIDKDDTTDKGSVQESKTFQVYFTNCTVNLLGYRV